MEDKKELFSALVKAQAEMGKAAKDTVNTFFNSKYANLASCTDAIRPVIAGHGLAYIQICHDAEKSACVETIIIHQSGQQISCGKVSVPVNKNDAQGYGSAMTYARRHSLSAAFGLATEDDDGNDASKKPPETEAKKPQSASQTKQYDHIAAMRAMNAASDKIKIARIIDAAKQIGASKEQIIELANVGNVRVQELEDAK